MTTTTTSRPLPPAQPATTVPWGRTPATELPGTEYLFLLYLVTFAIEYGGLTGILPILRVLRVSTIFSYLVTIVVLVRYGRNAIVGTRQGQILLFLTAFSAASIVWAIVQTHVVTTFRFMCDYLGLFISTVYLLDRPSRIKKLAIVASAVLVLLFGRNIDLFASAAGADRLVRFRTPYFMGDGNDFAWGAMTLLTFPMFLMLSRSGFLLRMFGAGGALCAVAIVVLTQSRGGALALAGAVLFYAFVLAKRRTLAIAGVVVMFVGVWLLAPSQFRNRMETINEYQEDSSAQGRIRAWKAATQMAFDYPLGVGAGNFSSAYGRYYRPDDLTGFAANRWISAHSVYFKTLGELGFIGCLSLIALLLGSLFSTIGSLRIARNASEKAILGDRWPAALCLGLVGYAMGGVFLGGVTYPHLFLLMGLAASCRRLALAETVPAPGVSIEPVLPDLRGPVRVRPRVPNVRPSLPAAMPARLRTTSGRGR